MLRSQSKEARDMRTPIGITRDGAVAELTSALRATRNASQERRLRALLAVAKGEYKWVYLFGATCPASGAALGWIMPTSNSFCMNLHLAEISRSVAPDVLVALVLDNAGWHASKTLHVPDNITLMPLPPYSPELNSIEPAFSNS